jgi:hypothetical protein
MKEQESSLKSLQVKREQLEEIIESRTSLFEKIGTGRIQETSSPETAIKVGRVKSRVLASIERCQNTLANVSEQINQIKLVENTQKYIELVALRKGQIKEIKDYVKKGLLKKETLQRFVKEFKDLKTKGKDPEIQQGLAILRKQPEKPPAIPKKEEELPMGFLLNSRSRMIQIGSRQAKLGKKEFALFAHLAQKRGDWCPMEDLAKVTASKDLYSMIFRLREKIEDPTGQVLISKKGAYQLKIPRVFHLQEKHIQTLSALLEKPNTSREKIRPEEEAILAAALHIRRNLLKKYGLSQLNPDLARRLIFRAQEPLKKVSQEELNNLKKQAAEKMLQIVRSGNLDKIYDQTQDQDSQDFLITFLLLEDQPAVNFLSELLTQPIDISWREMEGLITEVKPEISSVPQPEVIFKNLTNRE